MYHPSQKIATTDTDLFALAYHIDTKSDIFSKPNLADIKADIFQYFCKGPNVLALKRRNN